MLRRNRSRGTRIASALLGGVALAATAALSVGPIAAQGNDAKQRQERQIGVMGGILDQVLIDSPNFFVRGAKGNTRGLYLDEYGAIFTFKASLASGIPGFGDFSVFRSGDLEALFEPGARPEVMIVPRDRAGRDSIRAEQRANQERIAEIARERARAFRSVPSSRLNAEERDPDVLYRQGKEELVQTLLDYGSTLTTLRDDHWITVVAYLEDSSFLSDSKISRLTVKARVRDLRGFASGRVSEDSLRKLIQIEES